MKLVSGRSGSLDVGAVGRRGKGKGTPLVAFGFVTKAEREIPGFRLRPERTGTLFGHDQDKKPLPASGPRADISSGGKNEGEHNRLWHSLATGPNAIQPKLAVSQPDDPHEREADRVAEAVMRTAEPSQSDHPLSIGDGPQKLQRACDDCEEEEQGLMRKTWSPNADVAETAPPIVGEVLSSAGQPLDRPTRSFMESRFETDFGDVRVHADERAANSASAVGARAYTVDRNIVFGAGEYAPDTSGGRQLLSHELAHVVQQRRSAAPSVQRQIKFSSKSGGHRFPSIFPLTHAEVLKIFTGVANDLKQTKVSDDVVYSYVQRLNQAFRVFKIDTVEAQAAYIANAYVESDQLRYMTETMKFVEGNQPYESDPSKVKLDTGWLKQAETGTVKLPKGKTMKVTGYQPGGPINPKSDWDKSFIGRGPIQVTTESNYVQTLALMEKRADELKKHAEDYAQKKKDEGSTNPAETTPRQYQDEIDLREAIAKIKADPREAANPKYAFMFSAGFMKMAHGDVSAAQGVAGLTSWMGQQPAGVPAKKETAYWKAIGVLMKKYEADKKEEAAMYPP